VIFKTEIGSVRSHLLLLQQAISTCSQSCCPRTRSVSESCSLPLQPSPL